MWTNKFVHNPKVHFNYLHMIKKLYDLLNLIEIVDVLITSVWRWGSAFNSFVFWFMIFTIALDYFFVFQVIFFQNFYISSVFKRLFDFYTLFMEDGGVDRTVIDCWQNQLGQMADFPHFKTFNIFDL